MTTKNEEELNPQPCSAKFFAKGWKRAYWKRWVSHGIQSREARKVGKRFRNATVVKARKVQDANEFIMRRVEFQKLTSRSKMRFDA